MKVPSNQDLIDFVLHEVRLLDDLRFDDWLALFADDGRYWMPLERGQTERRLHCSLMYEDKLLLKVRIERLKNPRSFSQQQASYCQHVMQAPSLEVADPAQGRWVTRAPFSYFESQLDTQVVLAGVSWLHLVEVGGVLRIRLKKVELLNCDAALPSVQLFP